MATPKLNLLAQRFMQQIQDPITIDSATGIIYPGNLIQTVAEIESILGDAMLKYINNVWTEAKSNRDIFIGFLPELFKPKTITFTHPSNTYYTELAGSDLFDLMDILDSNSGNTLIEVWNPVHLADAKAQTDPFYTGGSEMPGIIYQKPLIWLFPASIVATADYSINLNYISLPVNPVDGSYLTSGGDTDIQFNQNHLQDIADYATKLYKVDDYQEDPT